MNVSSYIIDYCKNGGNNITNHIIDNKIVENVDSVLTNTNESECINGSKICSSRGIINLMSKYVNVSSTTNNIDIVKQIEDKLNCDSESCVLNNPDFNSFVKKEIGHSNLIQNELNTNFKTSGPRNTVDLLSNFNIDETLLRWAREFKTFYPCPFTMIDFKIIRNQFATTNLANIMSGKVPYTDPIKGQQYNSFKTYACVLNTDVSNGRGKHWVCIFVDCRSQIWTIEYFNSSGNPPCRDVNEWMEIQRSYLLKIHNKVETITVTNLVHQRSNTECGMYVLYYIRSRLDNIPYQLFLTKRIEDTVVTKFRKHVFRKN